MQAFSFGQINVPGQRSTSFLIWAKKCTTSMLTAGPDYVFVDEHNRHKRLKGKDGFSNDLAHAFVI